MGHGHGDGHGHGLVSAAGRHQRPLLVAFTLTLAMEIAPPEVDVAAVEQRLVGLPGVVGVHALHLWTLTSGIEAASCHLVMADGADAHGVLDSVGDLLRDA